MGWSGIPLTDMPSPPDHVTYLAQIRSAILERQAVVGGAAPLVPSGLPVKTIINNYRLRTELLIPYFGAEPTGTGYIPSYTINGLMTSLFGAGRTTWIHRPSRAGTETQAWRLETGDLPYIEHINELYTVLNALQWVGRYDANHTGERKYAFVSGYPTWAAAWAAVKTAWDSASWVSTSFTYSWGQRDGISSPPFGARLGMWRLNLSVADWGLAPATVERWKFQVGAVNENPPSWDWGGVCRVSGDATPLYDMDEPTGVPGQLQTVEVSPSLWPSVVSIGSGHDSLDEYEPTGKTIRGWKIYPLSPEYTPYRLGVFAKPVFDYTG